MNCMDKLYKWFWSKIEVGDKKRMAQLPLPEKITAIVDIPYIDDGDRAHLLDVYCPEGTTEKLPTIIDIHGGGLMYAYKELNKNYNYHLAERGFAVISISYSLAPENRYPACIRDVCAALKWIGENIDKYACCDKNAVFITGDSAGGLLAAQAVLIKSSEEMQKAFKVEPIDLDIKAAGLTSGMFDFDSGLAGALSSGIFGKGGYKKSPLLPYLKFSDAIDKGVMPPCYVVTSAEDMIHSASIKFKALLDAKGIENKYSDFAKGEEHKLEHVFSVLYPDYPESQQVITEMTEFFIAHLK